MMRRASLAALLIVVGACDPPPEPPYAGPAFTIDPDAVSVSGISAGAYMAGQMHVAKSASIRGAGLIAGGPYGCAQNSLTTALETCTKTGAPEVEPLLEAMAEAAEAGTIDSLVNLEGSPVWLFRSPADPLVGQALLDAAAEQYRALGSSVTVVDDIPAAHGVPTLASGAACDSFESPYLNACDYDAAGEILAALHGDLKPRVEATGELQSVTVRGAADASLLSEAYLYVPMACAAGETCGLHVFFHGCSQSSELVGDAVARGAGFNEWAEANRLLVLYPQVASSKLAPMNPLGCFDWWGYTDHRYATRFGTQVQVVSGLMEALAGQGR
ncbi:MAG: PHB depolymerase family esterase [Woeseiaceae bacterium]|jgi:poly(3-hydroxybutyrate) depolymerase|nr:PHB depolymerase family esterase [Woeseiaceae bacterium]